MDNSSIDTQLIELKQPELPNTIENIIEVNTNFDSASTPPGLLEIPIFTMPEEAEKHKCGFLKPNGKLCRKKLSTLLSDGSKAPIHCPECTKLSPQSCVSTPSESKYSKELAGRCLFGLQLSAYMALETVSQDSSYSMVGLSADLMKQKNEFEELFERMYEEYGPELIDQIIGPISMWAIMSTSQIITRIKSNRDSSKVDIPK